MIALVIFLVVFYIGLIVMLFASMWKIFTKAGKPGWACLIPIYNTIILLEIVGKPWWWLFLMMIPIVNIILGIKVIHLLSLSFGKDTGFTLGLIFLSFIFIPILGLGKATYQGPGGVVAPAA